MQEMQETQVQSLVGKIPSEEEMATRSNILPVDRGAWQATVHGVQVSEMTEQVNDRNDTLTHVETLRQTCEHGTVISRNKDWAGKMRGKSRPYREAPKP